MTRAPPTNHGSLQLMWPLTSSQRSLIFKTKPHWIQTPDIQPTKCLPLQQGIFPIVAEVLSVTTSRSWVNTGNLFDLLLAFWLVDLHFKIKGSQPFLGKRLQLLLWVSSPATLPPTAKKNKSMWYTELPKLIHNFLQYNLQVWP